MANKEELRKKRQKARRRKQAVFFGAAGIVCLVLIVVIARGILDLRAEEQAAREKQNQEAAAKETETEKSQKAQENQDEETLDTVPVEEEDMGVSAQVTISAAGDFTLGTDENFDYSTSLPARYEEVQDPGYFLQNVKDIFASDDLTIVNLEGPLTTSEERADKQFSFKGDPSYTEILTSGSVEACNLANNHSKDYGIQGYEDTIANVEAAGIKTFGYERTAIWETNGVKVGLAGVYELAEGMDCQDDMTAAIQSLKDAGADLVIVSFHWGVEKENYPDETQQALAHAAIDQGADLVLGHHPHVLQGIEKYQGKYIVYSLGNFCFGGNKNPSDKDTMIFQQTFTLENGEVVEDDAINIIPCRISSEDDYNNYQPTPAEGEEAQRILGRIQEYSQGFGTQLPSVTE
ncbi:CapA family protein [Lacrimispora saccharolytica]|nr:CapA family protein [Lacrimispora saccharolytica]